MLDLATIWFILIAALLAGYAILDGFDLGVGMLHLPLARTDRERRLLLNAIGPVWDGNEVWLLAGAVALFAAFPKVYATIFSGFYLALVLVLLGLVLRAVSLELRSKLPSPVWREAWDVAFAIGSFLPSLFFGVALGNILRGLPLTPEGDFAGTFASLFNPLALLVGALTVALFLLQGAAWLVLKTEGALKERARRAALGAWIAVIVIWVAILPVAYAAAPTLFAPFARPLGWVFPTLLHLALIAIPISLWRHATPPFAFSSAAIVGFAGTAAASLFPNLVPSLGPPTVGLTVWNACSSPLTLRVMLTITLLGVPIVLAYTAFVYHTFRGPVELHEESY